MRIEMRDRRRERIGQVQLEPGTHPTRARTVDTDREVFLDWEHAVDDSGQIRRCLACGCEDMFNEKAFPQVTGIVVVLAFAGALAGVFGLAQNLPVMIAMIVVLLLDLAIFIYSRVRLVCYRCRTSYHELPIARYHRSWDRSIAERYPAPPSDLDDVEVEGDDEEQTTAPPVRPGDDAITSLPPSRLAANTRESMKP